MLCVVPDVVRCGSASSPVGRFSEVRGVMEEGVVNVSVSWQPPENPRGLIVNYTLVMMSYTSGVELARAVVPPTTTSHTFTQLTLGKVWSGTGLVERCGQQERGTVMRCSLSCGCFAQRLVFPTTCH